MAARESKVVSVSRALEPIRVSLTPAPSDRKRSAMYLKDYWRTVGGGLVEGNCFSGHRSFEYGSVAGHGGGAGDSAGANYTGGAVAPERNAQTPGLSS